MPFPNLFFLPRSLAVAIVSVCVSFISLFGPLQAARAQTAGEVLFVLDGSNSMWGQIDGIAKIAIAKDVMSDLITDWDAKVPVGMMIYGHRRKGDCQDIEVVAMPGQVDRPLLIDKVKSISPRGKTPISLSLTMASAQLLLKNLGKYPKPRSSLVLVSDGLETCGADPCETARNLDLANPGLDVHVIGFDVTNEESLALQCIADNSGGKFFRANNASELQAALKETVKLAKAEPKPAPPPAPPATASKTSEPEPADPEPSLFLYAKLCESCDRLAANKVRWSVKGRDGGSLYEGLGILYPSDPVLAPGRYPVTARYESSVLVRDTELIIGGDGQQVGAVNLMGGTATLFAYATDDKSIAADPILYQFFPLKDGKAAAKALTEAASSNSLTWLPAGRFKVVASHGTIKESAEIDILPGEKTRHDFDMRVGYIQPSSVLSAGTKPLGGFADYAVFKTEQDARTKQTLDSLLFLPGSQKAKKPLKPGQYVIKAFVNYNRGGPSMSRIFPLEIKANETATPQLDMQAGLLSHKVGSASGQRIINIDYMRASDDKRVHYFNQGTSKTLALPQDRYYLRVMISGGKTFNTDAFDIKVGQATNLDVAIP